MKKHYALLATLLMALILTGCSKGKDEPEEVDPLDSLLSISTKSDDKFGNFIIVNQADEDIYISSSPSFSSDAEINVKVDGLSSTLNLNRYFSNPEKLVKLYALRESELAEFVDDQVEAVSSIPVLVSEGGTFSPFGTNNNYSKFGEMRVCNKTGKVLAYTYNDVSGPIEGMIGRTNCNFPISIPAKGALDLYFLDAETLAVEETWSDIVAEGSFFRLEIGEGYQSDEKAKVIVRSRVNDNVQIVDIENQVALNNLECDLCPYLPKLTTGEFEITPRADYKIEVRDVSGNVLAQFDEIILLGSGDEIVLDLSFEAGQYVLEEAEAAPVVVEPTVYEADIMVFNTYCSTWGNYYQGQLECTLNYLGDARQVEAIHYELIDTDGTTHVLENVSSEYVMNAAVTNILGVVSIKLYVDATDGERYESSWLDIDIVEYPRFLGL